MRYSKELHDFLRNMRLHRDSDYINALLDEIDRLQAEDIQQKKLISGLENMVDKQTKKLYESKWIELGTDEWSFASFPCDARFDKDGVWTHYRKLPPAPESEGE